MLTKGRYMKAYLGTEIFFIKMYGFFHFVINKGANLHRHHKYNGDHKEQQRGSKAVLPGFHVHQACYQKDKPVVEVCKAVQYRMQRVP